GDREPSDATRAQQELEVALAERAVRRLVDHRLVRERGERRDDVVPRLAADEKASERTRAADLGARATRALELRRIAVREVGRVALARVDDEQPRAARGFEQTARVRHDRTHPVDAARVVGVAAALAE